MPEKPTKVQLPGQKGVADAFEVPVVESTERWTDVALEDGSKLRIKATVLSAIRAVGHFDQDGNPIYQVKVNQIMTVSAPDHLRKPPGNTPTTRPH